MSYNTPASSATSYGVVEIGANINVANGIISLPQSIDTTATPTFATVTSTGAVTDSGNRVLTGLTAGTNVVITGTAPNLTVSVPGTATPSTVLVTGVVYTALPGDYYIGVNNTLPVVITLPLGINGKIYIVKNELGPTSGTITTVGTLAQPIDGALTNVNSVPYGSTTFIFRSTSWFVI